MIRKLNFVKQLQKRRYQLSKSFIEEYSKKETNFGFNGLGETVRQNKNKINLKRYIKEHMQE